MCQYCSEIGSNSNKIKKKRKTLIQYTAFLSQLQIVVCLNKHFRLKAAFVRIWYKHKVYNGEPSW